jgi:hypothetical protein
MSGPDGRAYAIMLILRIKTYIELKRDSYARRKKYNELFNHALDRYRMIEMDYRK